MSKLAPLVRRQAKRKPRGKAKPIPAEAKRLARSFERLQRLQASPPLHEENRAVVRWAGQWIRERLLNANIKTHAHFVRELERGEPKAERVIRVYWPHWNAAGLQWGERQQQMQKLGFAKVGTMPDTTFKSLCRRKLRLKYRPAK
jgi:hypothetical protein